MYRNSVDYLSLIFVLWSCNILLFILFSYLSVLFYSNKNYRIQFWSQRKSKQKKYLCYTITTNILTNLSFSNLAISRTQKGNDADFGHTRNIVYKTISYVK